MSRCVPSRQLQQSALLSQMPYCQYKPCHLRCHSRQAPVSHPVPPASPHSSALLTSQIANLCLRLRLHPTSSHHVSQGLLWKPPTGLLPQSDSLISRAEWGFFFFLSKTDHVCQEDSLLKDKLFKTLITMNMSLSFIPIRSESRERLDTLLGEKISSPRDYIRRPRTICASQCVCYLELMLYVTLHFEVSVFLKLLSLLLLFCVPRDWTPGSCLLG